MKFKAFTLAETLVTLSVIGVVCAMVVPNVVNKYQEQVAVSKLRTVYSELNQSFDLAVKHFGPPQYWGLQKSSSKVDEEGNMYGYIPSENMPYERLLFGLKKELIDGKEAAYQPQSMHGGDGIITKQRPVYRLQNGATLLYPAYISSATCSVNKGNAPKLKGICGDIKVDLNGSSGPNKLGEDVFLFYFGKNGFVPFGSVDDTSSPIETQCNKESSNQYNGYGCTAWVIYKGNRAYLKRKISW